MKLFAPRETSTHYARPSRPAVARAFNALGALAPHTPLEPESLLDEASRKTGGLADFGDPSFRAPLAKLLTSIDAEAKLHALGRTIMRGRIVTLLENRLRIEAFVRAHAEIDAIAVRRPIVIAGLQRTGTTMLHRLLAADPRARALYSWEALAPVPLPGEGDRGSHKRRRAAKLAELGLRALSPEFFAIHPVEADAPEEDVLLLDMAFMTQAPEATLHVPTYAAWLESQDAVPSYRFLHRTLQALHWQQPGEHWVLKTPHHMEYLRELLAVFPDAVIVQTHRDPQATMGSFCSMVAHGRGIFSDHVDPREVGRHWLRKVRRMVDRSLAVRDGGAAGRFIDVSYDDLVRNPIAQVERIYDFAGMPYASDARAAMEAVKSRDVQHRHGRHVYRASDFGLSPATIEQTFADYRARFAIRREKTDARAASPTSATGVGHQTLGRALATAVMDVFTQSPELLPLGPEYRLEGKTALVTGGNSGLGRAVATDLARRGARVILAVRSGIPEAGEQIARAAGAGARVEMLRVDLADLDSVVALADGLAARGERLDLLVCNAGLMPAAAQPTRQGFEVLYGVHFFANYVLLRRLLASGVIPNAVFAHNGRAATDAPRVVFVASETHRSSHGLDFSRLGALTPYGVRDGLRHYGDSKLAMVTFATELARRLGTEAGPSVAVHSLCPGPVASRIARDAPAYLRPAVDALMKATFRSPDAAAAPVVFLAAAPELSGVTGWYLHVMRRKGASERALDPENGRRLWARAEEMLAPWLPPRAE